MRQELIEEAVDRWRETGCIFASDMTMQELLYVKGVIDDYEEDDDETGSD